MGIGRRYGEGFKKKAVKLTREIGNKEATEELDIPRGTWGHQVRKRNTFSGRIIESCTAASGR